MLRGKAFHDWDASLIKNWKFEERFTAQSGLRSSMCSTELRTLLQRPIRARRRRSARVLLNDEHIQSSDPVVRAPGLMQFGFKFIF